MVFQQTVPNVEIITSPSARQWVVWGVLTPNLCISQGSTTYKTNKWLFSNSFGFKMEISSWKELYT